MLISRIMANTKTLFCIELVKILEGRLKVEKKGYDGLVGLESLVGLVGLSRRDLTIIEKTNPQRFLILRKR